MSGERRNKGEEHGEERLQKPAENSGRDRAGRGRIAVSYTPREVTVRRGPGAEAQQRGSSGDGYGGRGRWASNSYFSRMRANNLNFEIINSGYNDSPHMCDSALIRDSARTPSSSLCLNSRVKQTRNGANIGIYGNRYMCEHTRELYLGWRERDREAAAGAAARRPQGAGAGARRRRHGPCLQAPDQAMCRVWMCALH